MKLTALLAVGLLAAGSIAAQTVESIPFRAVLSSKNEVPAIDPTFDATGAATIWAHVIRDASGKIVSGSVDFSFNYRFPADTTITAAHIHRGAATVSGPVVIDARPARTDVKSGFGVMPTTQTQITADNAAAYDAFTQMIDNPSNFYFNVHTSQFGGGAMRGQLQRAEMAVLLGEMSTRNEVPPITDINGTAQGMVMMLRTRDASGAINSAEVMFEVNYTGMPAGYQFTAMHIHSGRAGANGPVTVDSAMTQTEGAASGSGIVRFTAEANLTRAGVIDTLEGLTRTPENYYLNIHGVTNPGGVLRTQLRSADKATFTMDLSPANEVPPITGVQANAPSAFTLYTLRDADGNVTSGAAIFDTNPRFPVNTRITAMHIHDQVAGQNGPVTIDSNLGITPILFAENGAGNIFRIVSVTPARAATMNSLITNPERHYLNVHTSVNGGGFVRSQLIPASTDLPSIGSMVSMASIRQTTAAPGALMAIFGQNLSKSTGTLSGNTALEKVPNGLNGTSATIANLPMPVLLVSPQQVIVQVPTEAPPGRHPVVVKSANGSSEASEMRVDESAPTLFSDETGGLVLKNSDYSLVRPENPARAGDILLVYWTGAGNTTPTVLGTGQVAPAQPYFNTKPVTATVGGANAEVIYSIASPGQVGLYQTAIRMPNGIPVGTANIVFRMGTAESNAIRIAVR